MKARQILVAFCFGALAILSFSVYAQERTKTNTPAAPDDIASSEQQLARQFGEFQDLLMRLKTKLSRGNAEEKKRAETLDKVLELSKELAINQEFAKMIQLIQGANLGNTRDLDKLQEQSGELARRLAQVLELLRNANVDLSRDRQDLELFLKRLQKIIDAQETARLQTDLNKTDRKELENIQKNVTDRTKDLSKTIQDFLDKDKKKGQAGEAAITKGDAKDGGKGEGKKGEAKDAGKEGKGAQGEAKDAGDKKSKGSPGEAKPGQDQKSAKAGAEGEPKSGAKPGDPKGKEGQPGAAKESKDSKSGESGAAKENKGDSKSGPEGSAKGDGKKDAKAGKEGGPPGNAKPGDDNKKAGSDVAKGGPPDSKAKPGGEKGAPDSKAGAKESKGAPMAGDPKPGDAKPGDAKAGDAKPGDAKPGDAKAGDAKPGGPPMAGSPMPPPPPGAGQKPGDAPPPPPNAGNPPNKQNDDTAKANKQIQEAGYPQVEAEKKINKGDNKEASGEQKKALDKLLAAQKELERLLKQMREEEMERVLAALEARCVKMLQMQQRVLAGTKDVDVAVTKLKGKADRPEKIAANKLSDDEKEIVQEANKCIDILKSEGSAVAFPEVFQQIRDDMIHVQNRLGLTDVGGTTQGIEQDIIDTLKEMIEALKKAQDDLKDSKPGKPGESKAGKPGDQKLLELIQELKMVRSLQKRINDRTEREGKRSPGEQANDPQVIRELRNLSERQLRLQEVIRRIANGDNK